MSEPQNRFFHLRSATFAVADGEDDELVNPGTYGRGLCEYLETRLRAHGHDVPSFNCEDWGWWLVVTKDPVRLNLQIYGHVLDDGSLEHAVLVNETPGMTKALRPSKRIDRTPHVDALHRQLTEIFDQDADIEIVQRSAEFPLY